ncbi:MAG: hypothetical protein COT17_05945 [Elusimicrobia bacterium CG08_land_8_20_14_0_20_51_18]|nr:MAG: hypothetical protein COT17_05945 [Elusimicrobia bacterium CG08_land_8_20_14_0_20_51_18]
MRITITGGTGFIGKAVARKLLEKGHSLAILTRKKPGTAAAHPLKADYFEVDYSNPDTLEKPLENSDLVIHLAAALFCRSKKGFFRANADSTANLIKAANRNKTSRFLLISSLAAGGPTPKDSPSRDEKTEDAPVSYYGKSKLAAEKELLKLENGNYVILRPPIVYGPKDSGFSKIAEWVRKGIMIVPGNSATEFNFVYLEDLVESILRASEENGLKGEKFYVCENKKYPWLEFIEEMAGSMKVKMPRLVNMPASALYAAGLAYETFSYLGGTEPVLNRDKAREAGAGNWICSPEKWEKSSGFTAWTPLKEGLSKTFREVS